MNKHLRIEALANQVAAKIKALAEAHQIQIAEIYRQYREQAANIQEGNADELSTPSVTPDPKSQKN